MDNPNVIVFNLDQGSGSLATTTGEKLVVDSTLKNQCILNVQFVSQGNALAMQNSQVPQQTVNSADENLVDGSDLEYDMNQRTPDENYYSIIRNYILEKKFPLNLSETRQSMLKHRAKFYCVRDGKLYHSIANPKLVVTDNDFKMKLMQNIHICKKTGVHIGVQKMHSELKKEYFWCGMYTQIAKFVRQCNICMDQRLSRCKLKSVVNRQKKVKYVSSSEENSDSDGSFVNLSNRSWEKIEFSLNGPFENKYLLIITDPSSGWMEASCSSIDNCNVEALDFAFGVFCRFGFPQVTLHGFEKDFNEYWLANYKKRFLDLTSSQELSEPIIEKLTTYEHGERLCSWIPEWINNIMNENGTNWIHKLPNIVFQYNNSVRNNGLSPFQYMFQRKFVSSFLKENKENSSIRYSLRLRNSKIAEPVQVYQNGLQKGLKSKKMQLQEYQTKQRVNQFAEKSASEDDPVSYESTENPLNKPQLTNSPEEDNLELCQARANTVSAVKALLSATKEERRKRGQYKRYTTEIREEIASYTLQNGILAAVKHFKEKLGKSISESTIRNFAKNYQVYTPQLQEQIGLFAIKNSLSATIKHFSTELGIEIRPNTIRRFKKLYSFKYSEHESNIRKDKNSIVLSADLKAQIGQYAFEHGIPAAVEHFSNKLEKPLREVHVNKYKEMYLDSQKQEKLNQNETIQTETIDVVQASYNLLNCGPASQTLVYNQQGTYQPIISPITFHSNTSSLEQSMTYQQQSVSSVITTTPTIVFTQAPFPAPQTYTSTFTQLSQPSTVSTTLDLPTTVDETQIITSSTVGSNDHNMILSQHPILIAQSQNSNNITMHIDNLTTTFETQIQPPTDNTINFLQPSTISYSQPISTNDILQQTQNTTNFNPVAVINNSPAQVINIISVDDTNTEIDGINSMESEQRTLLGTEIQNHKGDCVKRGTRGTYTTHSPEIRAKIGKYAAKHGNSNTISYFQKTYGLVLPESTVRGLKQRYRKKINMCKDKINKKNITALGFAPRGRPTRLGVYDDVVRDCIQELVNNGERVTSFLAIATAKQVLLDREPSMLSENGGPVNLTTNWAKSFLKRIGIHNNS